MPKIPRNQLYMWGAGVFNQWGFTMPTKPTSSWYDNLHAATLSRCLEGRQGKGVRPWNMVDVTKGLDSDAIWMGVEFETGFATSGQYQQAVSQFWNTYEHSCIDKEGCGENPVEFTFSPVNLSDFETDEYFMDTFLTFLKENSLHQSRSYDDDGDYGYALDYDDVEVGIHCNFSSPAIRKNTPFYPADLVVEIVNEALQVMDEEEQLHLFGRRPYGYLSLMNAGAGNYIEGKLFNSTHDMATWKKYKSVMAKLAVFVDHLYNDPEIEDLVDIDSDDLYNFLSGEGDVEDVGLSYAEDYEEDDE